MPNEDQAPLRLYFLHAVENGFGARLDSVAPPLLDTLDPCDLTFG